MVRNDGYDHKKFGWFIIILFLAAIAMTVLIYFMAADSSTPHFDVSLPARLLIG